MTQNSPPRTTSVLAPQLGRKERPERRATSEIMRKYGHLLFVLPGLVFFVAVMVGPTLFALVISLTNWTGRGISFEFIGLQNFQDALSYWPLYRAAINNVILFVAMLIFQHTVGLFIAVQLNEKPRFMEFYRAVLFMPVIISLVSTGFIWTLMLSSNIGFINPVLRDLGLGFLAKNWLSDPATALPTVIAVTAWNSVGWAIVIYLSGLQNVPEELKQAAHIDGANGWQTFWRVVFPQLSPSFTALTVLTFIGTFKTFDLVYVLTGPLGSPNYRTDVVGTLIYRTAFGGSGNYTDDISMSFAIALALVVFAFMTLIAWALIKILRRREIQS
ncbi:sugar ABC transporter permease [Devosia rhodophyticola]|uniref:Sugar ABC transporter permease n=1 Tax=Devosia rhodophyticola TaxID=3026423 RepID=A0ABY7YYN2_9HYPH|nr:sugar ABC transporter permease [Devosia rhodophyticola]WDR06500.1 sugar ABC transporter permease [Devosia rhodophyticola]